MLSQVDKLVVKYKRAGDQALTRHIKSRLVSAV